jgi:hypothetical protein
MRRRCGSPGPRRVCPQTHLHGVAVCPQAYARGHLCVWDG